MTTALPRQLVTAWLTDEKEVAVLKKVWATECVSSPALVNTLAACTGTRAGGGKGGGSESDVAGGGGEEAATAAAAERV